MTISLFDIDTIPEEYVFSKEEIKALNKFLQHQYISYEDLELLEVVRKISRIANELLA